MKNTLFYLLTCLYFILFACTGDKSVVVGQKTTMEIDSVFDAGVVVKGEIIYATFKVKNT